MTNQNKACSNKFVTLKSLRNLRPWFKDAASDDVQDVIDQLEKLKREKIHEEDQKTSLHGKSSYQHEDEKTSKNQLQCIFDPQDVLDALIDRFSCRARRYRSARVKYRYLDLQGNVCEWSGQGREPTKLKELLRATGKKRDDFLVKDEDPQDLSNFLIPTSVHHQSQLDNVCVNLQDSFAFKPANCDSVFTQEKPSSSKKNMHELLQAIIDTENATTVPDEGALINKDSA